ncbi:MAG: gfo/Idh/MocA family oxidoreductase, partial [Acinetobacter sp.]
MKNKKILKVGIIGSGFAASFHFEALKKVCAVDVDVLGAYSTNHERLKQFTEPKNIKSFATLNELIIECEVLHVCTPPATHEEIILKILQSDKYAIVEKPLTGYFGDDSTDFNGDHFSKRQGLFFS